MNSSGFDDDKSYRYALIASILFIVSFLAWFFVTIVYEDYEWNWKSAYATFGAITSVFLLCSILFAMLGKLELSRKSLVAGTVMLIVLIVLFAVRAITYQPGYL